MKKINLNKSTSYFKSLIDDNGIIQFTKGYEKDYRSGYAIEDQARALILSLRLNDKKFVDKFFLLINESMIKDRGVDILRDRYGKLSGIPDEYKEASAEVFWAVCELYNSGYANIPKEIIEPIITNLKNGLLKTIYPRVIAYTLLGLYKIGDLDSTKKLGDSLLSLYLKNKDGKWQWFEDKITYANPLLPWSLFLSYELTKKEEYLEVARESMQFLLDNLIKDNTPLVIGNEGWWRKGKKMPLYGQQPIDISYMAMALLNAERITENRLYFEYAKLFYSWFHGNNLNKKNMIRDDGACYDGLYKNSLNINAGAESNICYLLASLQMKEKGILT